MRLCIFLVLLGEAVCPGAGPNNVCGIKVGPTMPEIPETLSEGQQGKTICIIILRNHLHLLPCWISTDSTNGR